VRERRVSERTRVVVEVNQERRSLEWGGEAPRPFVPSRIKGEPYQLCKIGL
jgi:hypothetical protein